MMAVKTQLHVEGLRELEIALNELPKATGRNVQRRALINAATVIREHASRLVPVRFGHLKRSLAISRVKLTTGSAGKRAFAEAMAGGATRAEAAAAARAANLAATDDKTTSATVVVGPGRQPQAITQEFGTRHHPAQPFMRPAWDGNRSSIAQTIREELATEIEKARKRLAKKAERLAAQMKAT